MGAAWRAEFAISATTGPNSSRSTTKLPLCVYYNGRVWYRYRYCTRQLGGLISAQKGVTVLHLHPCCGSAIDLPKVVQYLAMPVWVPCHHSH
eukprot:scaffold400_cov185-Amphora_coffeaeformis.AAC.3